MLSDFKWYRKLKGGVWSRVFFKQAPGCPIFWMHGVCKYPENVVETEHYGEGVTCISPKGKTFFIECKPDQTSDGYHTFEELYSHRCLLFLAFLGQHGGWKSRKHGDGTDSYEGWFIAGTELNGKQITYHIPNKYWSIALVSELDKAPEFDGHTSNDVLHRLMEWLSTLKHEVIDK